LTSWDFFILLTHFRRGFNNFKEKEQALRRLSILILVLAVLLPPSASAKTFTTHFAPTFGMRIGSLQAVFGAKGEWVIVPLDNMMGLEFTTEFSVGEGNEILNFGFHPKFRYPIDKFTPYAGMGFSIVHVFGLPEQADAIDACFDILAGFEWAFSPKISLLGQVEGHIDGGDFVDLETGLVFHL
jgi:hypothetical protein